MSDERKPYELGQEAARQKQLADTCPFEMGRSRREWFAGYFAVKPPPEDDTEPAEGEQIEE